LVGAVTPPELAVQLGMPGADIPVTDSRFLNVNEKASEKSAPWSD
jgi:hypothetical protein